MLQAMIHAVWCLEAGSISGLSLLFILSLPSYLPYVCLLFLLLFFQLELVVKWEMHDQDDKVVYCWELPVKIVSGEDDLVEMWLHMLTYLFFLPQKLKSVKNFSKKILINKTENVHDDLFLRNNSKFITK